MKNSKLKSKKLDRTAKQSHIAGIQVRSGVKAGKFHDMGGLGGGEMGNRPGGLGDPG